MRNSKFAGALSIVASELPAASIAEPAGTFPGSFDWRSSKARPSSFPRSELRRQRDEQIAWESRRQRISVDEAGRAAEANLIEVRIRAERRTYPTTETLRNHVKAMPDLAPSIPPQRGRIAILASLAVSSPSAIYLACSNDPERLGIENAIPITSPQQALIGRGEEGYDAMSSGSCVSGRCSKSGIFGSISNTLLTP
ncbi:hypothetical protein C5688_17750 [Methylocystis sp. MitZ-2018]|nr:hypothetical protein C5688_17750 [Methylocystis sp. MitZ-2018]